MCNLPSGMQIRVSPLPRRSPLEDSEIRAIPISGPGYRAQGAANVIFNHAGSGETPMPPGLYDVTLSRGMEYTTYQTRISVEPGKTVKVAATLKRVVDTSGFISGDFHLHSEYSTDSNVTLRDRVIGLVAEGVEFAVSSDHNNLADYRSAIKELGLERELKSTIGDEVTLSGTIHFNVFPLEIHPDRPRKRRHRAGPDEGPGDDRRGQEGSRRRDRAAQPSPSGKHRLLPYQQV